MPSTLDIVTALAAALAAAAEATRLQAGVASRSKPDGSPVTDGDLAADRAIRAVIALRCPGDSIFSEECADDLQRLGQRRVWIIDPIDGTEEYLAGRRDWAVQVALAIDGRLALGILAMPGLSVTALGIPGRGAWQIIDDRREPLRCATGNEQILVASASRRNRAGLAKVRSALPGFAVLHVHSIGVKVWRIIDGDAALFVYPRTLAEWDAAAPAALLLAAGGHATDLRGAPLRFNGASGRCPGVVFSRRADHQALIARLAGGGVEVEE